MGIIAAFIQALLNILLQRASIKPLNKDSLADDIIERMNSVFAISSVIIISIAAILSIPEENRTSFVNGLRNQGWWWLLIVFIVFSIAVLFFAILSIIKNLKKYKVNASNDRDLIKYKDTEIVGRLIELQKRIGVEYTDSFKFFQKLIKKYNQSAATKFSSDGAPTTESFSKPYVEFIKDFRRHTNLKLENLNTIFSYASNSSSSIFKCVVAFDEYFEDNPATKDDEITRMLRYFCCFKNGAENNHINRIFTIPGIPIDSTTYIGQTRSIFNTSQTKKKNNVILKYLITNKICSIDTYLLIYDNANIEVKEEFFALADYVIAISANNSMQKENRIFFAYPKESETNEKTISTIDPFILALMDADYEYRLSKLGNSNHLFNIEELKRANKEKIYASLNFITTTKEGKEEVNAVIKELEKDLIKICKENSIKDFHSEQQIKSLLSGYKL